MHSKNICVKATDYKNNNCAVITIIVGSSNSPYFPLSGVRFTTHCM